MPFQNLAQETRIMFTFHTVNSENWEEVLDIFWNYFMPWEPATRLAGCCIKNGYRIYNLDSMLRNMLKNKTCWMAKNNKNEIVGVIFCTTVTKSPDRLPTKDEYLQQGWPVDFTNVLILLDQLCNHQKLMCDKKANIMLDLFALVVKTDYRGHGLATQLIEHAIHNARNMNVFLISISCTSSFSQRCSKKLDFSLENIILYKDWSCDGQKIINDKDIDPLHPAAISYYKVIS
jgi:predicted GNAT family acetyltransferase